MTVPLAPLSTTPPSDSWCSVLVEDLVAGGVLDVHAGVAVAVHRVGLDEVVVGAGGEQQAGVAGVADGVATEDVLRGGLQQHAAVAVELRVDGDAVDEVVLEDVAVGLPEEDRLAEVGADLAVADGRAGGAVEELHAELVLADLRVGDQVAGAPVVGVVELDAGDGVAQDRQVLQRVVPRRTGEQHAVAELLDGAVADRHVVVAAVADAGREALFLPGAVLDQVVGAVDDVAVEVDDDVRARR